MIRKFFASPVFVDDEEKTRIAGLLNTILLTHLFVVVVPVANFLLTPDSGLITLALLLGFLLPLIGLLYFMRRGFVRPVSIGLIIFLLITAGFLGVFSGGKSQIIVTYYPLIIVIAGLLLGANSAIITALISSVVFGVI